MYQNSKHDCLSGAGMNACWPLICLCVAVSLQVATVDLWRRILVTGGTFSLAVCCVSRLLFGHSLEIGKSRPLSHLMVQPVMSIRVVM